MLLPTGWTGHVSRTKSGPGEWRYSLVESEIVGGCEELETDFNRNVHIGNIVTVTVSIPVVEILDHFVKDHSTIEILSAKVIEYKLFQRKMEEKATESVQV